MKYIFLLYLIFINFNQMSYAENLNSNLKITGKKNFLHEIPSFNGDNSLNVVVEIPVGSNEKWEVSKIDGSIKWEKK